ncbi:hypothetical protein CLV92_104238 [Kineococcus xinjiangensis]|uniref:Uncharacterized protein n=1 Tax=Kineococcus xinjiangensis TaxID=512762 RepID=A0A2S6IT37_9ACTN|nr:hypothetical protein [Kineococcus xinjiangensis]PPK97417.1 hypothetical protein CLV92_104238 [Kineococcus xinjiangensis]
MRRGAHRTRRSPAAVAGIALLLLALLAGAAAAVVVLAGDALAAGLQLLR